MREEKTQIIDELKQQVGESPFVLMTDYTGMTVTQFADLRKKLRGAKAECHVVKNSMLRLALKEAGLPEIDTALTGMTAVVFGGSDAEISTAAKVLKEFGKEFEKPKVKLGVMGQEVLPAEQVSVLADLPSLDVLRGHLIGLIQSPATKVAMVLGAPAGQLARVIQAFADKEGGTAEDAAA